MINTNIIIIYIFFVIFLTSIYRIDKWFQMLYYDYAYGSLGMGYDNQEK